MKNELTALKGLRDTIEAHLNEYIPPELEGIGAGQVVIDYPDVDKMAQPTMFFVYPDYAEYEPSTTCSDNVDFRISVFLLCKRDTQENLIVKTYGYYNALYHLLKDNTSLDGVIDQTRINDADFDQIEGNPNVHGALVSVSTIFEKDF